MDYKKPQSTIVHGGAGIYPLTTADQVILADGSRLEKDGKISADSAANSEKLGGKSPEYYIQPRNLLDNSDFRNPVNQRGKTSYIGSGYIIDRWYIDAGSCTIENGNGVIVSSPDDTKMTFMQHLENIDAEKVYTFAIKDSDGNVYLIQSTPGERIEENTSFGTIIAKMLSGDLTFAITISAANSKKFIWAALYEGAYTAETLPPYVPKGYAAELAECLRYFERLGRTFSEVLGNAVYAASGAASIIISIHYSPKRIKHPTIVMSDVSQYRVLLKDATNCNTYSASNLSAFGDIDAENSFGQIKVAMTDNIQQDSWLILQRSDTSTGAYIDVSADL